LNSREFIAVRYTVIKASKPMSS